MKASIEFFFDPISPFSYLATTRIDELASRHGRKVIWRPTLVGVTVTKVMGLKPVPETPLKSTYFARDAQRLAQIFGVPLRRHGLKNVNSLAACRAFLWVQERDDASARRLVRHLSARLWVDGIDITPRETVVAEAASLGIEVGDLSSEEVKHKLAAAVDYAIRKNVFGVPFFIADDEPFWGCDRMWMLDYWLATGRLPSFDDLLCRLFQD
jgi:2-hydroxychromene-2-carboxylate isomerase